MPYVLQHGLFVCENRATPQQRTCSPLNFSDGRLCEFASERNPVQELKMGELVFWGIAQSGSRSELMARVTRGGDKLHARIVDREISSSHLRVC